MPGHRYDQLTEKNIIMKALSISFIALCLLGVSCTKKFVDTNTDPNRIDKISPGTLLNPTIYEMISFNMNRADDFTFEIMQVSLPFPSSTSGIHRLDVTEGAGNSTWSTYYRWLINIKEMREASKSAADPNYEAIAMTLNAWVYSLLTDCFGDVPMSEASRAEQQQYKPKFDTQKDIYTQILADLEAANNMFVTNRTMPYATDLLFSNSVISWKRFCNSLRLRLLLRVSKRDEMDAFTKMAEIFNNPTKYPIFTKNEEAAVVKITGVTPNISPWGRAVDFTTFQASAAFFCDQLNTLNDPRRAKWMSQAKDKDGNSLGYKGIPSGYVGGTEAQYNYTPSNKAVALVTAPMIAPIMTYGEIEFIRAELIQRGKLTGNAQTAYENAVKASMELWGATLPANYFSNAAAAYNGTLERIMLQKYFALFFVDYQQWFEYRRTGFPVLPTNDGMVNNKIVPVRFKYPVNLQIQNKENLDKAVQNMGGDNINVKVWWEK